MKLYKNASGKPMLKITKSEWLAMGKKAGWLPKKAGRGGTSWGGTDEQDFTWRKDDGTFQNIPPVVLAMAQAVYREQGGMNPQKIESIGLVAQVSYEGYDQPHSNPYESEGEDARSIESAGIWVEDGAQTFEADITGDRLQMLESALEKEIHGNEVPQSTMHEPDEPTDTEDYYANYR